MELQHVNIKLLLKNPGNVDLELLVPVFHSWIQEKVFGDERLLDIADYRHVHDGPGVILIGLEGDYSVDKADGRLGVRYNRKAPLSGSNVDRLKQAARAVLSACQRLEGENSLGGKLQFNGQDVEIFVNDRLLAPNNEETRRTTEPEFKHFFDELLGGSAYTLSFNRDSRRLFSVLATAQSPLSASHLLQNLSVNPVSPP